MNQKHLLKFIKKTLEEDGAKDCCVRDGKVLTLDEVFRDLNVTAYELTVDSLGQRLHIQTVCKIQFP